MVVVADLLQLADTIFPSASMVQTITIVAYSLDSRWSNTGSFKRTRLMPLPLPDPPVPVPELVPNVLPFPVPEVLPPEAKGSFDTC